MTVKINKFIHLLYILTVTMIAGKYFSIGPFDIAYLLCLLIMLTTFLANSKFSPPKNKYEFIPLFFTLSYIYGVGLGLLNGNPTSDVFSNFAGLFLFFFLYYFSISKLTFETVLSITKVIAIIFVAEIIVFLLIGLFLGETNSRLIASRYMIKGLSTDAGDNYSRYFITNSSWVFILIFLLFDYAITGKREYIMRMRILPRIKSPIVMFTISFILLNTLLYLVLIKSGSKGFLLACIINFSVILISFFLRRRNIYNKLLASIIIIIFLMANNNFQSILNMFTDIFSADASGNSVRLAQIDLIRERLTIFGNGLGANFESDDKRTYGLELTYMNLIDKLGLIGFLIGIIYFSIFLKFASFLIFTKQKFIGLLGLGLTSFIWPSIGNPMLLSVSYVIALLFSIRLISIAEQTKKQA